MAPDPDERWQSAHDVQLQLGSLSASGAVAVAAPLQARGRLLALVPWGMAALVAAAALDLPAGAAVTLCEFRGSGMSGSWSRDGLLFAAVGGEAIYRVPASSESGRNEVYISPYPSTGEKTLVSTTGGVMPRWSRDGRELFFVAADRRLTAVAVRTTPALELGTPRPLFPLPGRRVWKDYDVAPEGGRFLAIVSDVRGDEQPLTAVLNWAAEAGRLDR